MLSKLNKFLLDCEVYEVYIGLWPIRTITMGSVQLPIDAQFSLNTGGTINVAC